MTAPDSSSGKPKPSFRSDTAGYWLLVGGVLFGLWPLILSIVASWFGSNIGFVVALVSISLPVLMAVWAVLVIPLSQIIARGDMGPGMPTPAQLKINGITASAGYLALLAVLFIAPLGRLLYVRSLREPVI